MITIIIIINFFNSFYFPINVNANNNIIVIIINIYNQWRSIVVTKVVPSFENFLYYFKFFNIINIKKYIIN